MANLLKVSKVQSINDLHTLGWSQRRSAAALESSVSVAGQLPATCEAVNRRPKRPPGPRLLVRRQTGPLPS
jgi:hypothetical protein